MRSDEPKAQSRDDSPLDGTQQPANNDEAPKVIENIKSLHSDWKRPRFNRRELLLSGLIGSGAFSGNVFANKTKFWNQDRRLWLRRESTKEEFDLPFVVGGQLHYQNYVRLCYLLRDVSDNNTTVEIDVALLNLLYGVQEWARKLSYRDCVICVNSGHRTARHNARVEGAALNSMHLYGKAVDITMNGVSLPTLASMASFFGAGGIGSYATFLHVDVGTVRHW